MSQTTIDQFLMNDPVCATAPTQQDDMPIDPKYFNLQMVTPVGRVAGMSLVAPNAYKDNPNNKKFFLRLILNPSSCDGKIPDLLQAVGRLAMARFPSIKRADPATGQLTDLSGWQRLFIDEKQGGLHNPIYDGNLEYAKDPAKRAAFRNMKYIQMGVSEKDKQGNSNQPQVFDEKGAPITPDKIYLGCYARAFIAVFAYPPLGATGRDNEGISFILKSVQFVRHGERMTSYDAVSAGRKAFAAAGALPTDPTAPSGPVGGFAAPAPGFAAPPAGFAAPGGAPAFATSPAAATPWTPPAAA
jgi:hypothetical protein